MFHNCVIAADPSKEESTKIQSAHDYKVSHYVIIIVILLYFHGSRDGTMAKRYYAAPGLQNGVNF